MFVPTSIALIVASGRGLRFGGDRPKQYLPLLGKSVLRYSLKTFSRHPDVSAVRAVIHPDDRDLYEEAASGLDVMPPVFGGETRQDSVRIGLESLAEIAPDRVLIHDGARPLVDRALIDRILAALKREPAILPALPVADTLKRVSDGSVGETVNRDGLFRAQTPQAFAFPAILNAHRQLKGQAMTDDAALAEACGLEVSIVPGDETNLKITTMDDLERASRHLTSSLRPRTGMGFDVHRLEAGDGLVLMGLTLPEPYRMIGHSDADVGLHALTDALLGAMAAGDIGSHFPPSDAKWKGADSTIFLEHAVDLVKCAGGVIDHVDITLICERPKIGPYREAMTKRLGALLHVPVTRISVKATTTERLGFTGRGEGIAAQAVATVSLPA